MIFSTIAQIMAVGGGLMTPIATPLACQVAAPPIINIRPVTEDIQYDTSKTSAELNMMHTDTESPYGLDVDQTTGGLRHDHPKMSYETKYRYVQDPRTGTFCMSYSSVNVDIQLQPRIYIAKEYNVGSCGREVLKHEKNHVYVDRMVLNKYAKRMGTEVQRVINSTGAIGPYPMSQLTKAQNILHKRIENALKSVKSLMDQEMKIQQKQVDSLKEYERVSKYCTESAKKVFDSRRK